MMPASKKRKIKLDPIPSALSKTMSHKGKMYARSSLDDLLDAVKKDIKTFYYECIQFYRDLITKNTFHVISDTGLVALSKIKYALIAVDTIDKNQLVTHLPLTNNLVIPDDVNVNSWNHLMLEVDGIQGTVIKKFSPFIGFGAYSKLIISSSATAKANCELKRDLKNCLPFNSIALFATRIIVPGEEIICVVKPDQILSYSSFLFKEVLILLL